MGLPPGVTTTCSAAKGTPRRAVASRAMAVRSVTTTGVAGRPFQQALIERRNGALVDGMNRYRDTAVAGCEPLRDLGTVILRRVVNDQDPNIRPGLVVGDTRHRFGQVPAVVVTGNDNINPAHIEVPWRAALGISGRRTRRSGTGAGLSSMLGV